LFHRGGLLHPRHHRGNVTSTESSWECDIHGIIVGMLHPRHHRGNVTSTESSWECDIHGIIVGM
jgi:hypothetical protein